MIPVALDLLPVQASAVPCERVFSSSKETDTDRRSKLDPVMMETLQILKYSLHEELNFTDGFLATEEECAALSIDPYDVQRLYEQNRIGDLVSMFEEAQQYGILDPVEAEVGVAVRATGRISPAALPTHPPATSEATSQSDIPP